MTKTFKELKDLDSVVASLYQKDPTLEKTKFGYAYKRFVEKNYVPVAREYNSMIEEVRINNALEGPNKELLVDQTNFRGYKYNKEGLLNCIKEEKKIMAEWDLKEFDIVPFTSVTVPEVMTEEEKEALESVALI